VRECEEAAGELLARMKRAEARARFLLIIILTPVALNLMIFVLLNVFLGQ
jgi:predicted nucleic acid-binding Zn ribbon protein